MEVKKMRITVNLSEETLKKVDDEAKKLGTSRGAMLTTWIGEKVNSLEQTRALFEQMFNNPQINKFIAEELAKKEDKKVAKK